MAIGFLISVLFKPVEGVHEYSKPPDAFNCKGWPTTTAVSFPAKAIILGRTFTTIVSNEGLGQPESESYAANTYRVVTNGNASGVRVFEFISVFAGAHIKFVPFIEPVNCVVSA